MIDEKASYYSTQHTRCAICGEDKHTPLRRDEMGGYVCLTCIDNQLDELLALREANRWIPVSERLPEAGVPVLVMSRYWCANPFVARLHNEYWEGEPILSRPESVTHWRPLPAPPEQESNPKGE